MNKYKCLSLLIAGLLVFVSWGCNNTTTQESAITQETAAEEQPEPLIDVNGNVYKTVKIGDQLWMAENLRVTKFRNGDPILNISGDRDWSRLTSSAYCNYNNDSTLGTTYGRLYNWYAVNDERNIAPEGWHVPTTEELNKLMNFLGGDTIAGAKIKEAGTAHWLHPNTGATNESGFSALPGGYRFSSGSFHTMGSNAYWWASGNSYEVFSWNRNLLNKFADIQRDYHYMNFGFSLRCVKD